MLHVVILAGGAGKRLWPTSTSERPKPVISFGQEPTLFAATVDRVQGFDSISVLAGPAHKSALMAERNINCIEEPSARNTAAAVALAVASVQDKDPAGVVAILPADQYVTDDAAFNQTLRQAFDAAQDGDAIVTLGIKPTFPHTGYGYIEVGSDEADVKPVASFTEKPDSKTAEQYVQSGRHYWNAGVFVAKAETFAKAFDEHTPGYMDAARAWLKDADPSPFNALERISFDYAIAETYSPILCVPCDCGWSDVGNWSAVRDVHDKDQDGNVVLGPGKVTGGGNNLIVADSGRVVLLGVSDLLVVKHGNDILVTTADHAEKVKQVAEEEGF